MDMHSQRMHLRRILAGEVRCRVGNITYVVEQPTLSILSEAEDIFDRVRYEAGFIATSEQEIVDLMCGMDLWSDEQEHRLTTIPTSIEALKVEAWQAYLKFSGKRVDRAKKQIKRIQQEWYRLYGQRHAYDHFTPSGLATTAKNEFLILSLIKDTQHIKPGRVNTILSMYYQTQLDENQLRTLSQSSLVRLVWHSSRDHAIIDVPVGCWTNEQIGLMSWLRMYDSIGESLDCPPETVVQDDILLDGWLITQNRERDKERANKLSGDDGVNMPKKPGIQEVYIPAETSGDADRIHDMNDAQTRFQKRQREKLIATQGEVDETKMPDSQLLMRQQALQEILDRSKRR